MSPRNHKRKFLKCCILTQEPIHWNRYLKCMVFDLLSKQGCIFWFPCTFLGHIINSSFWTYAPHWPLTYHLHYHLEKVVANVTWLSGVVKSHHIKEVVNVTFWQWGGERLILHWGWWTSGVVNVWGGERLGWWTSDFTQGVVNVWGGERLGWWMSGWWTSYNRLNMIVIVKKLFEIFLLHFTNCIFLFLFYQLLFQNY